VQNESTTHEKIECLAIGQGTDLTVKLTVTDQSDTGCCVDFGAFIYRWVRLHLLLSIITCTCFPLVQSRLLCLSLLALTDHSRFIPLFLTSPYYHYLHSPITHVSFLCSLPHLTLLVVPFLCSLPHLTLLVVPFLCSLPHLTLLVVPFLCSLPHLTLLVVPFSVPYLTLHYLSFLSSVPYLTLHYLLFLSLFLNSPYLTCHSFLFL
jgi:hypothetical protein